MSIDLPASSAGKWLRTTLGKGSTLWRLLPERLDLDQGGFESTLPQQVGIESAKRFKEEPPGIRQLAPTSSTRDMVAITRSIVSWQIAPVVQLIKDHLSKGPNNIAVVGNEGIKKGDRLPQNVSLFRFFGTEVYNLLLPDSDESLISTSIQGGRNPWRAPGVLTSVAQEEKEELRNVETLTLSTLEGFVDGTTTVFAAAYDEWGFVIWKRRVS